MVKLRKQHHNKAMKQDFFALLFENGTLGRKICTFLHLGMPFGKKGNFLPSGTILKVVQKSLIYIFVMK